MPVLDTLKSSPWLITAVALVATLIAARLLVSFVTPILCWLAKRSRWDWDDLMVKAGSAPLCLLLAVQILRFVLPWLKIPVEGLQLLSGLTTALTTVSVLWGGFRLVDFAISALIHRSWVAERPATRSLLAISRRFAKVVIVLISAIAVLAHLGVSVASLLAGLGVGGLALALAAQKTVENLFGTLSIGVDQPFRETDFIRVGELTGTVEAIGLRSTRIRTPDRTLVTIPNGKLADLNVESYAARDRMRMAGDLALDYSTKAGQLRKILEQIEQYLRGHAKIWPDDITVRFKAFGNTALIVEVNVWFQTTAAAEFAALRQEALLAIMEIVEGNGARFASAQKLLLAGGYSDLSVAPGHAADAQTGGPTGNGAPPRGA